MDLRKFKIKILKRDPKQIKFDFQKKIEPDKEKVFVRKNIVTLDESEKGVSISKEPQQIREPENQRNYEYLSIPSLHNYIVSIQEDIDLEDVEFIKYIFNRASPEFKNEIINSILYEHSYGKKDRIFKNGNSEIDDRISSIYREIEKYQEVTLDDIRELLLLFSKEDIEYIADSIDELEEDFSETLDIENEDEKE